MKRRSPEVKCLHPTSSRREMCTSGVSNVIYHKFSHGAAFNTLNEKNVNVMLESMLIHGFSLVNARLLTAFGTAFYAITLINTCVVGQIRILMHSGFAVVH